MLMTKLKPAGVGDILVEEFMVPLPFEIILAAMDPALAEAVEVHCGHLPCVRIHRGSILDLHCDAIVSPANSFGFMDGGIDAAYLRHFGSEIQDRVQSMIRDRHNGELLVGMADMIETGHSETRLCNDGGGVTVPTALILAKVFGNTAEFWLNVQRRMDLWNALNSPREVNRLKRVKPIPTRAA